MTEAAFFDLDKTVIAKASVAAFGRRFYREGLISRRSLVRGLYAQLVFLYVGADEAKIARMRASMLDLTKGWDQAQVKEIVEEALERIVEPIIFAEALDLIAEHRANGRIVVIVSASPEEIVLPLARYLDVDRAIASRAKIDDCGRYTGQMEYDAFGPAKANSMLMMAEELHIDLSASYAYSDSATDLPMLEVVGHPVAVNPDRELQRVAQERSWEIRRFVRRVRLRDRVAVPRPGWAVAGAVATASTAGVIWWLSRRSRCRNGHAGGVPGAWSGGAERTARRHHDGQRPPAATRRRRIEVPQSTRSFLAAMTPRVTRTARRSSFFMLSRVVRTRPTRRVTP